MPNVDTFILRLMTGLIVFLALAPFAHAIEIRFSDEITSRSMANLINKVAQSSGAGDRNITIRLDSGGGDLQAALSAARSLRQYGVNTAVSNDCSSSCTVLFSAGRIRIASSQATFMFHAVLVSKKNSGLFRNGLSKEAQRGYVQKYASLWLAAVRTASPRLASLLKGRHILINGEQTFSGRELRSYGYVND